MRYKSVPVAAAGFSAALPKVGLLAAEPYAIYTRNTGAFDNGGGHLSVPDDVTAFTSVIALKYEFTLRLTVEALPSVSHVWNSRSNVTGVGDLPVELEHRFNDENNTSGYPFVTPSVGMALPTGDYDPLHTSLDDPGSGAYTLKERIFQLLFDTAGHPPVRIGAGYALDQSASSARTARAIEYNFSDNLGIAGVEFSIAGRNTSSYVAPQIALTTAF